MDGVQALRQRYEARFDPPADPARKVGVITPAAPIELILAAGLQPYRLFGNPGQAPDLGDKYMEPEIDGEVRSVFDQMLRGAYTDLPLILLPRSSEQHLQMHYYVAEVRKWESGVQIPPVQIVDVMQTDYWSTGRYVRARFSELAGVLGQLGHEITEERLRAAITGVNAMRMALQGLNVKRRAGRILGSDMFRLTALFGALPVEEFLQLAGALADHDAGAGDRPKVMLSGAMPDDPGLYELIEAKGAHVVAEDHVGGERLYAHLVDEAADPMEALTEHYQLHVPGVRQYPQARQDARFYATCQAAGAEFDLCMLEEGDDTLGWDWPHRRDHLAGMGIVSHLLAGQNYFAPDRAEQAVAIAALLAARQEVPA